MNPLSRWKPAHEVSEMMQEYRSNSYLFGGNAPYVEEMYEQYRKTYFATLPVFEEAARRAV